MKKVSWASLAVCASLAAIAGAQYVAPGYYHASTLAEGAQTGFANVVAASGQANLMNSEAVQNLTQARSQEINNKVQWSQSYQSMRLQHREYMKQMNGPRVTDEVIARNARAGMPKRLGSAELDPLTGNVNWPVLLREKVYAPLCTQIDKLFVQRASAGAGSPDVYAGLQKSTGALLDLLDKNIDRYKVNDYTAARKFIESLAYEAQFPTT